MDGWREGWYDIFEDGRKMRWLVKIGRTRDDLPGWTRCGMTWKEDGKYGMYGMYGMYEMYGMG